MIRPVSLPRPALRSPRSVRSPALAAGSRISSSITIAFSFHGEFRGPVACVRPRRAARALGLSWGRARLPAAVLALVLPALALSLHARTIRARRALRALSPSPFLFLF